MATSESSSEKPAAGETPRGGCKHGGRGPWRGRMFTEEERKVLRECRSESFWHRAFPLATVAGISTYALVQRGILNPNKRFGAVPKVLLASFLGYGIGKMMYMGKCREKFMKLEGSPFGEMARRSHGEGGIPCRGFGPREVPGYWHSYPGLGEVSEGGEGEGEGATQTPPKSTLPPLTPWSGAPGESR